MYFQTKISVRPDQYCVDAALLQPESTLAGQEQKLRDQLNSIHAAAGSTGGSTARTGIATVASTGPRLQVAHLQPAVHAEPEAEDDEDDEDIAEEEAEDEGDGVLEGQDDTTPSPQQQ